MRQFFSFWWRCARLAARGNAPHANDWQWVFASPLWQSIGAVVGATIGGALKSFWPDAPVIASDTWAGVFLGGLAGFVITWIVFFLIRFVSAPAAVFHAEKHRADDALKRLDALNSDGGSTRDAGIGEAVSYICFREWGHNFRAAAGSAHASGAKEYDELLQALADGQVPAWGKTNSYGVHEPIPVEYWFNNRIDWFSLLRNEPRTEPSNATFRGDAYTSLMTSRAAVERYWPAMGASGPRAISALRISFGMEDGNTSTAGSNLYQLRRTLSLKLENIGQKALSSCKLIVESSDAKSGITFPLVLREGITLAPGEHIFIPLVRYGEALEPHKFNCADSFATLVTPDEKPLFDVGESIQINLKVTGLDTPPHTAQCRTWISQEGRLQIQREWPRT
jgi:hypothetical protein